MSTPSLPADDLESRLRAAFAERAGEVQAEDLDPDLPHGVRIPVDDRSDGRRSHHGRARWLAVAAAVALIGTGIGLAARGDDGTTTTATSSPAPTSRPGPTTTAPRSEVFDALPAGVDPAAGDPLFVTGVHTCPDCGSDPDVPTQPAAEAAMVEALASLGDVTEPMPTDLGLDTWDSFYAPTGAVDEAMWAGTSEPDERGGVVVARPSPGGGWGVVAVTSKVIDLSGIVRDGDRLSGEVRVAAPVPVSLEIYRARSDGGSTFDQEDMLHTGDVGAMGGTETVMPLGKVPGDSLHVGDGPIVVRVQAGAGPGQVDLDGEGVAALAAVGIPGPDAGEDVDAIELPEDATTTDVDPGASPMWQPGADAAASDDAVEVTGLFVEVVLGEEPAWAGRPGGSSSAAIEEGQFEGSVAVTVPLASGADLRVTVAEVDGVWAVLQVGDGGLEVDTSGPGTSVDGITIGGGEESTLFIVLRLGAEGWSVERGRLPDDPVSFEGAHAVVLAVLDGEDRIIAAQGNALP